MSVADDNERIDVRIIEEAVAALSGIAAVLDPTQQPAGGSWVALTVHSGEEGDDVIQRAYFTSARHPVACIGRGGGGVVGLRSARELDPLAHRA